MEELKPCPFCGKDPKLSYSERWMSPPKGHEWAWKHKHLQGAYMIYCKYCFGKTKYCKKKQDAIKAWNTRV